MAEHIYDPAVTALAHKPSRPPASKEPTATAPCPSQNLYSFPPDLPAWRQRLFNCDQSEMPLTLSAEQWASYWPYVDNAWSRKEVSLDHRTEYFRCRRWRSETKSSRPVEAAIRKKKTRPAVKCRMAIKVTHQYSGDVIISRGRECGDSHLDTLDEADQAKIPSVFKDLAAKQVAKGYAIADIARNLRGVDNPELRAAIQQAGGKWMSRQDVRNAGASWLRAHPNTYRAGAATVCGPTSNRAGSVDSESLDGASVLSGEGREEEFRRREEDLRLREEMLKRREDDHRLREEMLKRREEDLRLREEALRGNWTVLP